jgi:3-hydroxybutyryl-CoA dehydrogenase
MTRRIETVAVLGAGIMGHALALVHALGGCRVALQDVSAAARARAPALIDAALATLVAGGEIAPADADAARARVTVTDDLAAALADRDLVVEAVVEDPAVKRALFAGIDAHAPAHALIASNTSYLDIFPMVPPSRARGTLIAHWYTPPYLVDLVDLVGGEATDPQAIETLRALYAGWGKKPVVLRRFIPGYVANRLQAALSREVNWLLDEGYATPQDIDDAVIHGLALRMPVLGHLMKADFTGLDMTRRALANATVVPAPDRRRCEALETLLAAGRGGVMSGAGFFDYGGRPPDALFRARDERLLSLKRHLRALGGIRDDDRS